MVTKFVVVVDHKDDVVVVQWNMVAEEHVIVVVHDSYQEEFVAYEMGVIVDEDVVQEVVVASFQY